MSSIDNFDLQLATFNAIQEHGASETLSAFAAAEGMNLSEEGLGEAFGRVIRRIQLRVNDAYAGVTYLKDSQLRDLAQPHEEGPNSTLTLPVSKAKSIVALLWTPAFFGSEQAKGQDRARKAYEKGGHARDKDRFIKEIASLPRKQAAAKLKALAEKSLAGLKKMEHELKNNKNLSPDEVRMISKAVGRASALRHK